MTTRSSQLRTFALSVLTLLLIFCAAVVVRAGTAPSSPATEPANLTITVSPFIVYGTGSADGRVVNYLPEVKVSDPNANLECLPGTGFFPRGGHKITCTATLGGAQVTESFFILVAFGDDTDVSMRAATQVPENPVKPASVVNYSFELRNNGALAARRVIVSANIPEALELQTFDQGRCTVSAPSELTCTIFNLGSGKGDIISFGGQIKPGVLSSFQTRMTVSLGDGQLDLEPTLNSITITTAVKDPGFGENALFLPVLRNP